MLDNSRANVAGEHGIYVGVRRRLGSLVAHHRLTHCRFHRRL